ncbi:hypothetical protein [Buchananella hordeovulneris]|uniref:hypothetical protein n=1 Tax=Buchananella hordeovulneris TaxID=52770 RepID=UPI0026DCFE5A|nr:hypothetical protein [Buchananella hordeovulneris]MDO5080964.1 hypothetical protein [Buchananella hordeovulneris]
MRVVSRSQLAAWGGPRGEPRWARVTAALTRAQPGGVVAADVAHSLGDSLTYRRTEAQQLVGGPLRGHRRYLVLLAPLDAALQVEVAPQAELAAAGPYSDLSDCQLFTPPPAGLDAVEVAAGRVGIVEIVEAARVRAGRGNVVVLRVTVEGTDVAQL